MLSFSSVEDVIIFHGVNVLILKAWMLSFLNVEDNIILSVKNVIIFHGAPYMLSFLKHWVLSFL